MNGGNDSKIKRLFITNEINDKAAVAISSSRGVEEGFAVRQSSLSKGGGEASGIGV